MALSPADIIASSNYALAKKEYLAATVETFQAKTVVLPLIEMQTMTGKKDDEDIVLGDSGDAVIHEPGTSLPSASQEREARLISLEDKETLKNYKRTKVEDLIDHTDARTALGMNTGKAIRQTTEKQIFQQIALGARTAATSVRPSGIQPSAVSGATVATAFPLTTAGSYSIQDALAEAKQEMSERHVDTDEGDLFAFLPSYLCRVLRKDRDLLSRDYDGPDYGNSLIKGHIPYVEGFWIIETQLLPNSDLSAATDGPTLRGDYLYRGDFSNTAFLGFKAGGVGARATPMDSWIEWDHDLRIWNIGAAYLKGLGIRRPEYCIEFSISGS